MPRKQYNLNDGIIHDNEFDEWFLSSPNTERLYKLTNKATLNVEGKYRFDNGDETVDVTFDEDGSWRDGADVTVTIESEEEGTYYDEVCQMFEDHWL